MRLPNPLVAFRNIQRLCRGLFMGPSLKNSHVVCFAGDAVIHRYLPPWHTIRAHGHIRFVLRLFMWRNPFTIIGTIISVVINALYRKARLITVRQRPCFKYLKRLPCVTYADSSCAIASVFRRAAVAASLAHSLPSHIKGRFGLSVDRPEPLSQRVQATFITPLSVPGFEACRINDGISPTITNAQPKGCFSFAGRLIGPFLNQEGCKASTDKIFGCCHA